MEAREARRMVCDEISSHIANLADPGWAPREWVDSERAAARLARKTREGGDPAEAMKCARSWVLGRLREALRNLSYGYPWGVEMDGVTYYGEPLYTGDLVRGRGVNFGQLASGYSAEWAKSAKAQVRRAQLDWGAMRAACRALVAGRRDSDGISSAGG